MMHKEMKQRTIVINAEDFIKYFGHAVRDDVYPTKRRFKTLGNQTDRFYIIDQKGETVMLFMLDKNLVTEIYSPKSPSYLLDFVSHELSSRWQDLATYFIPKLEELKNRGAERVGTIKTESLEFKPYDLKEISKHDLEEITMALKDLKSSGIVRLPPSKKHEFKGDSKEVLTITQKEYGVINSECGRSVINTFGLAECLGLVLYDRENHVAGLAHLDATIHIQKSLIDFIHALNSSGGRKFEARLFGGSNMSSKMILKVVKELERNNIDIVEADILNDSKARAIGIALDGTLYDNTFVGYGQEDEINTQLMLAGLQMDATLRRRLPR